MQIKTYKLPLLSAIAVALVGISCQATKNSIRSSNLTDLVDPSIGTGGHGHVFVGANVPFGAVQLGPSNISNGWDWVSGYHVSDSTVLGFAHTHLSGTGIGDLGDILILPFTGEVKYDRGNHQDQNSGAYSFFKKESEIVKPGYYAVHLDRFNVDAELTATNRVGFHSYKFNSDDVRKVLFNLDAGIGWEGAKEGQIVVENDSTLSGYRYSKGWAKNHKVYFTAVFSEPMISYKLSDSSAIKNSSSIVGKAIYGEFQFAKKGINRNAIMLKVALSPVSTENAKQNMNAELPGWNFKSVKIAAQNKWQQELAKIKIQTTDERAKKIFYTAFYHTMIAPSTYSDINGEYIGADFKKHVLNQGTNYTIFPMWDYYRAAQPLASIVGRDRMPDMINSMLLIFQQQGKLPVWHLAGNETDCMVGNPGIIVVGDAYLKGIAGFDKDLAYRAMKESAMKNDRGLAAHKAYGYVPYDKEEIESVAKGLEFAIADWTVAQVAKLRGEEKDYQYFLGRSKAYMHYFDKDLQFLRGKDSNGNFRSGPFDPFHSAHMAHDYTEGNAWQYTWLVPHDINNYIKLFGGEERFTAKLDSLFLAEGNLGGEASPDISGLIGQYAHGNEPSHHIIYMYPYLGQPWKTAEKSRQILQTLYSDQPDGLSGNEDVGQMSAWYIMSSLGFYQVSPAGGPFIFGSPLFDKATLQLGNDTSMQLIAHDNSPANKYIQSVLLNGKPYEKSYITYQDFMKGGKLEFKMGNKPSKTYGITADTRPFSMD